ncbi:methyltransferase, TIGR00027 family [Nonomuraea solani]|uniref:S-adenosyl-L-methionine-dependent methyltransferase n=1 Tax=Nonomuraea solani TaxID=1144553 RepID=A0A1H6BUZ7_9ACTN|nr:class I SAM-dependent methyltransferase [Nonomuraea solani]SEG64046.1 methyltransferase, TIGR00027 family [Nonomuraea solani]
MPRRSPAASSALGPIAIVAVEQHVPAAQRITRDHLAVRLLPASVRLFARAAAGRWVRDRLVDASDRRAPGVWGGILCRKRYADDKVAEALAAGVGQLVVLGAGYDTRACRTAGVAAFEVDLPVNSAAKRGRLESLYGRVPEHVRLVPADFQVDDLGTALTAAGFRLDQPAMVVLEGVTPYLTEDAVRGIFAFLAKMAPGSRLLFTYIRQDFLDGTSMYGLQRVHRQFVTARRLWHFGLHPGGVVGWLAEYGWDELEQVGTEDYRARYLDPIGRSMKVMEIERFVHAEKL